MMWEWGEVFRTMFNSSGLQLCVWLGWMWPGVPSPGAGSWKHLGCRAAAVVPVGPALGRDDAGRWGFLSLPLHGKGICAWRGVSSLLFSWEINRIQLWSYSMSFLPEMSFFPFFFFSAVPLPLTLQLISYVKIIVYKLCLWLTFAYTP